MGISESLNNVYQEIWESETGQPVCMEGWRIPQISVCLTPPRDRINFVYLKAHKKVQILR